MPEDKDSLSLKSFLGLNEVLNGVLSVVSDLGPHVVDEERLSEVVFIVREGHGFEVKGHHGSGFDVAELVLTGRGVAINVEELGHGGAVLGEVNVLPAGIPFLVVVNHMVGLRSEKLVKLLILENLIEDPHFVDGGLSALVSDASDGGECEEEEVDLPDEGLIEHQEGKTSVGNHGAGPAVVGSVQARVDLVKIVSSAHSPLPNVVLEDVVAVGKLVWVALGLVGLGSVCAMNVGPVVDIHVVDALGGAETQVIGARGRGLSETSHWLRDETSCLLVVMIME